MRYLVRFGAPVVFLMGASIVLSSGGFARTAPRYLIVSGDSMSGSWDSSDEARIAKWRAQYGPEFAWFRQDGRDYIVTDERTLMALHDAMGPQREINRQQSEVNRHQGEVNRQQGIVNGHQAEVNRAQAEVNRQQDLVNRGEAHQDSANRMQAEVNGKQQKVNAEQETVNQQQAVVNREQDVVNRAQERASAEIDHALHDVFSSALREGRAHEAR